MTRTLRRDHLRIWVVLAIVMLTILVASLGERKDTTPLNNHIDWSQLK